ncbi:hypothetical protein GWP43_02630 [Treponema vincentii]|uniref:Lipoprotein n=1 Tax=Treponema vincentii TaxID=69710 RepID=A0A6P1XZ38_9SPIR|nr:hypothetical protein [Treponema vincentii]QHX42524.1 hypothetical protein GWP43_02630 [Treponema vincentii]
MKQRKVVSMIGALAVMVGAVLMLTGCPDNPSEKPEYTKDEFTLKFKNESGQKCYIEIKGRSYAAGGIIGLQGWENSFDFPTVLKTEIPVGGEKTITVKDVVVSGKTSKLTYFYNPRFDILVIPESYAYTGKSVSFDSESKIQYTGGTFHIKLAGSKFELDYIN